MPLKKNNSTHRANSVNAVRELPGVCIWYGVWVTSNAFYTVKRGQQKKALNKKKMLI